MKLVVPGCASLLSTNKTHNAQQSEQQGEKRWWKEREAHCSKANVKKMGNVVTDMGA